MSTPTETPQGKGTGRWIAAFVLRPGTEPESRADHEHTQMAMSDDGTVALCRCGWVKRGRTWKEAA